ncbi:MAG: hypothetical protein AAFY84_10610 [Pseudomonadota bacterium]
MGANETARAAMRLVSVDLVYRVSTFGAEAGLNPGVTPRSDVQK